MEITKAQIAGLILGHLKYEKCVQTYEKFQEECSYIHRKGKHFITRVIGLSLEDILKEYAQIYSIVQGYLEDTNYFENHSGRSSLLEEINFLLEQKTNGFIPTSTPTRQNNSSHHREFSEELNATPSSALPGNAPEDYHRSSKRKAEESCSLESKSSSDEVWDVSNKEDVSLVLKQTFLDNRELQEKIAETINMVRAKPGSSNSSEKIPEEEINEIDAAVKAAVQHTEEDPIFNKILDEIIGTTSLNTEQLEAPKQITKEKRKSYIDDTNSKRNTRSSSNSEADDHNNHDAISSIIACSDGKTPTKDEQNFSTPRAATNKKVDLNLSSNGNNNCEKVTVSPAVKPTNLSSSSDIIVFNGTFDNYLKSNINCVSGNQSGATTQPIYLNTGTGLYMVPSNISTSDTQPQFYLLNSQPVINMNLPTITAAAPILSDRDIMTMPTVIVNEEAGSSIGTTNILQKSMESAKIPVVEHNPPVTSECITLYGSTTKKKKKSNLLSKFKKKAPPKKSNPKIQLNLRSAKNTKPTVKTPENKPCTRNRSPRSGSHIRNLDFSTPPKVKTDTDSDSGKNVAVKTLFPSSPSTKEDPALSVQKEEKPGKMWDSDLRALLPADTGRANKTQQPTPKRKKTGLAQRKKRPKKNKNKSNSSVETEDGLLLEKALESPVKPAKVANTSEPPKHSDEAQKEEATNLDVAMKYSLRNCNNAPNFKRKCNIDKTYKTCNVSELETTRNEVSDKSDTLVLSPSKLNASKRTLMSVSKNELITPDYFRESAALPIFSKKNITPLLKTPVKMEVVPKTPNIHNASNTSVLTPFTKIIEEQLRGIDISTIPTPNVPVTPMFPLTPSCDLISPYSNRPTDYSTSSSYYQPSDSEVNKSIEQLLEEEKLKSNLTVKSDVSNKQSQLSNNDKNAESVQELKTRFNQSIIGKKNLNLMKDDPSATSSSSSSSSDSEDSSETDSEWTVGNETVICNDKLLEKETNTSARYSLRKRAAIAPEAKTTVKRSGDKTNEVQKTVKHSTVKSDDTAEVKTIEKPITHQEKLLKELEEKRRRVINVMKETKADATKKPKRGSQSLSTITKKQNLIQKRKDSGKTPSKSLDGGNKQLKNRRKCLSPVKIEQDCTKKMDAFEVAGNETENTDDDFVLHLSSDDEQGDEKLSQKTVATKDKSNDNTSGKNEELVGVVNSDCLRSDQEAEELVKGLKERGIHLMHKKSPSSDKTIDDVKRAAQNNKQQVEECTTSLVDFDATEAGLTVVNYESDTVSYTFNERDNRRSLDSYNLELVNKTISAQVFDEDLNSEREINLKCSPFETLFERHAEVNILIPKRKKGLSVVEKNEKVSADVVRHVVVSPSRNVNEKNPDDVVKCVVSPNRRVGESIKNNVADVADSCKASDEEKLEIVNGVIMLNKSKEVEDSLDLMDYALIGSVREESSSDVLNLSPKSKKRKAADDEEKQPEKKTKTEKELLKKMKKIDVDSFLNKVHGGS